MSKREDPVSVKSTTALGNEFRDEVAALLDLMPSVSNVQTEVPIGSQDVDIVYEENTSFRRMRIACECKCYGKPLTRKEIAERIYPRYLSLLDNHHVDAVRIISPLSIGAKARAFIDEDPRLSFSTKEELEHNLIDFRMYKRALVSMYKEHGLDQYYVRPKLGDQTDLEEKILAWMTTDGAKPIAILAGYGMGKTSFALRLVYQAAGRQSDDQRHRIPIYIPLAEISAEQGLEGLLGKLLTAQYRLPNYHFRPFMELNRRGHFLIVLDGFDEMKHTMSWSEFQHNFTELNRLVTENSKVVLLGRPSALMSELEELFVLRGRRQLGDRSLEIPNAPDYEEIELLEFTEDQAMEFIGNYAAYSDKRQAQLRGRCANVSLEERIEAIRQDDELKSLIGRPVQAKMLADLATDPSVEWRSFTRFELYEEFIVRLIARESQKPTRRAFGDSQRIEFMREVAWWLWRRSGRSGFDLSELPAALIRRFASTSEAEYDGVKRDLVSGSLLEHKTGERHYFPHRSFLEYLVARHVLESEWTSREFGDVAEALTAEVVAFIKESKAPAKVAAWCTVVNDVQAAVTVRFLDLIAWALNETQSPFSNTTEASGTPRDVMIGFLRRMESGEADHEVINYLSRSMGRVRDEQSQLSCILCLLVLKEREAELRHIIAGVMAAFVLQRSLPEIKRLNEVPDTRTPAIDRGNPFVSILAASFSREVGSPDLMVRIDTPALYDTLQNAFSPKWRLPEATSSLVLGPERVSFAEIGEYAHSLRLSKDGGQVATFFSKYPDPKKLIPVTKKFS